MGFRIKDNGTNRWPRRVVPYVINPANFPAGSTQLNQVNLAINAWNGQSIIQLVPAIGNEPQIAQFVAFPSAPACQSLPGKQTGGFQTITCTTKSPASTWMHEIGHCLGLLHEHNRPDRNNFITVNNGNIVPSFQNQFQQDLSDCQVGPYDCGSIMHYGATAFSIDNIQPTITVRDPSVCIIGQLSLTAGDIAAVRAMYDSVQSLNKAPPLGDTSDAAPALAFHDGHLFLAWKGSGNDNLSVMMSNDDGVSFHGKHISPESSSDSPALASHNGRLFIAWKGSGNDNLSVATVQRSGEQITGLSKLPILGDTSDSSPAIASHNGDLYVAWKGSGNDNLSVMLSTDNGESFRGKHISPETSSDSPTLVSYGGRLYIAWKGSGNENFNVATVDVSGDPANRQVNGLTNKIIFSDTTELRPSLVAQGGLLFIAWKGAGNDNLNIIFPADNRDCTVKFISTETSSHAPSLAARDNLLWIAWKGSGNDNLNVSQANFSGRVAAAPPVPVPVVLRDGHIHELRLERSGWAQADLSAIVTNNPPAFPLHTDSPIFALVSPDGIPRIFYVGEDNHIRELRLESSGWAQAELSAIVTNNPPAFPLLSGSPMFALVSPEGIPRIFYVGEDNHIRELRLERSGWAQADLSAIVTNNPPAFPPQLPSIFPQRSGSPIFALVSPDGIPRIFYVGEDNDIRELRLESSGWAQADLSAIVTNNPPAFPRQNGSPIFALVSPDGIPRIFYVGEDNHIRELRLESSGWAQADLSAIVTNNPPAFPLLSGSPMFALVSPEGIPRIFYVGEDNHIHELRLERSGWAQADLSAIVTNNPPAFPLQSDNLISALVSADGIPRVFYVGQDNHIHELRLERSGWAQADLSAIVTNNPPAFPVEISSPVFAYITSDLIPRIVYRGGG